MANQLDYNTESSNFLSRVQEQTDFLKDCNFNLSEQQEKDIKAYVSPAEWKRNMNNLQSLL